MLGIVQKIGKYAFILASIYLVFFFYKIFFIGLYRFGFIKESIPYFLLPTLLIVVFRFVFKYDYLKSIVFSGGLILVIVSLREYIFEFLNNKYHFSFEEDLVLIYLSYLISGISFVTISYKILLQKSEPLVSSGKTDEKNPFRFEFNLTKGHVYLDNPFRGIYIQGGAGSGKSETFIKPIIEQAVQLNYSGILYDFKSPELSEELFARYSNINQTNAPKPYFIDFKNPLISKRVNPIKPDNLLKSAYAYEFSEAIMTNLNPATIKEKEWYDRDAQSFLTGLIWFLKENHAQYCTLPHVISLILHTDIEVLINEISKDVEAAGMVSSLKQAVERKAEKQVSAIVSTLRNLLSRINNADVFWILSGDDFSLDLNNIENPKFLCIGNDSTLPTVYAPAISLIISVATRLMNEPNKHHSIIILDEAPTIYIPNFERIPATARSNKIATVYAAQDYSQISDALGESKAQVILSNLGTQIYGRTSNTKTAEMIKSLFSKKDKMFVSKGKNSGTSGEFIHLGSSTGKSKNESIQERDRVKVSDIINLNPGEFYGIIAEGKPKEFLKEQFKQNKRENFTFSFEQKATAKEIISNYKKIVNEAKNLFIDESNVELEKSKNAKFEI